jgi:Cu(I)/Ag(I) efflux system membrane protein CusA/SilA
MQRIAVPMIGGMISSTLLTLIVIPAIYALVKGFGLPRSGYRDSRPNISTKHCKNQQRIPELAE